jgi:hypothetical protein
MMFLKWIALWIILVIMGRREMSFFNRIWLEIRGTILVINVVKITGNPYSSLLAH